MQLIKLTTHNSQQKAARNPASSQHLLRLCKFLVTAENMVSFESSDLRKIGIGLAWFGTTLSIIGLFLGNVFVVIGNIQLICGLILTVGPLSSLESLMNPQNHKASLSFGVGFVFILAGWIVPGLILEQYGVAVLFSGLWPSFSRKLPILGWVPRQTHVPSLFCRQKGKRLPV